MSHSYEPSDYDLQQAHTPIGQAFRVYKPYESRKNAYNSIPKTKEDLEAWNKLASKKCEMISKKYPSRAGSRPPYVKLGAFQ